MHVLISSSVSNEAAAAWGWLTPKPPSFFQSPLFSGLLRLIQRCGAEKDPLGAGVGRIHLGWGLAGGGVGWGGRDEGRVLLTVHKQARVTQRAQRAKVCFH